MTTRTHIDICCTLFLVLLLAVLGQTLLPLLPEPQLYGEFRKVEMAPLSVGSWLDGRFQDSAQEWFPRHVGFRAVWVRTDNQIDFSLFREARGVYVTLGKDNWLYPCNPEVLDRGWQFLSDEQLEREVRDLRIFQDALERHGIAFLFVLSPNKIVHYPEHLPDWVLRECGPQEFSNHRRIIPLLDRYGVHYVDAVQLFHEVKRQEPYLLFPQGGKHWSYWGASLVVDEILQRLEQLTGKELVNLDCYHVTVDRIPHGTDNDLGLLLNIWLPQATVGPTPHPWLVPQLTGEEYLPRILWVGSSFSLQPIELMSYYAAFRQCDFLFYNRRRFTFPARGGSPINPVALRLKTELQRRDVVVLEANENEVDCLNYLDYGLIDEALEVLRPGRSEP